MKKITYLTKSNGVVPLFEVSLETIKDEIIGNKYLNNDKLTADEKIEYTKETQQEFTDLQKLANDKTKVEEYRKAKTLIPCFIVSGTFDVEKAIKDPEKGHPSVAMKYLKEYQWCIMIDIDGKDQEDFNMEESFESLKKDKHNAFMFRSPSKNGIKLLFHIKQNDKVDGETISYQDFHFIVFQKLEKYFVDNYNLKIDKSCKDISRKYIMSLDKDIYENDKAKEYAVGKLPEKQLVEQKQQRDIIIKDTEYKRVGKNLHIENILKYCKDNSILIAETYDEWLSLGWTLLDNTETDDVALNYFLEFSKMDAIKYNESDSINKFEELKKSKNPAYKYKLKKYFALIEKEGYELTNTEKGMFDYQLDDLIDLFRDLDFGNRICVFSHNRYVNLKNINGKDEEVVITDGKLYSIFNFINEKFYRNRLNFDSFKRYFNDERAVTFFNGFEIMLEENATSDRIELDKYINGFHTTNDKLTKQYIEQWMYGVMKNVFEQDSYKNILILTGKQNIGKTYNIENNFLKPFSEWICTNFRWKLTRDEEDKLCSNIFILDDELKATTKAENENIKAITSYRQVKIRKIYGLFAERRKRVASFISTTNSDNVFNDLTGGVRFYVVDIQNLESQQHFDSIDYLKVWGFIYYMYKTNQMNVENFKIDIDEHNDYVDDYRAENQYEEYINNSIEVSDKDTMTRIEIIQHIKNTHQIDLNSKMATQTFGAIMKKLGFEKIQSRKNNTRTTLYYAKRIVNKGYPTNNPDEIAHIEWLIKTKEN